MPPLPRGICPICHREAALRSDGQLREHRDMRIRGFKHYPVCIGSGKPADPIVDETLSSEAGDRSG